MAIVSTLLVVCHIACLRLVTASEQFRFLVITSPTSSKVYWQVLKTNFQQLIKQSADEPPEVKDLIDGIASKCVPVALGTPGQLSVDCGADADQGLQTPTGIALHSYPSEEIGKGDVHTLYVSDAHNSKIFAYPLHVGAAGDSITVGSQREIIQVAPNGATWLTVDSYGNLYYTQPTGGDPPTGSEVMMINKTALAAAPSVRPEPRSLYVSSETDTLANQPSGLAVDTFFLYWANQDSGAVKGSVVKAHEVPRKGTVADHSYPKALAKNSDYTYGVCLAKDSIFYTAQDKILYGVKKMGGTIAEVSSAFDEPRGCAFDEESSVLVADEALGYVYALPSNMAKLRAVKNLQKVVKVPKPNQIAVLVAGAQRCSFAVLAAALAAAVLGHALAP